MRRRLTLAIVAVAGASVALFALPLAVVLRDGYRDQELLRLQRDTVGVARMIDLGSSSIDAQFGITRTVPASTPQSFSVLLKSSVIAITASLARSNRLSIPV